MGITSSRISKVYKTDIPRRGGVYLFRAEQYGKKFIKIGKTKDLKVRFRSYRNQNHTGGDFYKNIDIIFLREIKTKKQRTNTENNIRSELKKYGFEQLENFFPNQKKKSLDFFSCDGRDFYTVLNIFKEKSRNSLFSDLKSLF